MSKTIHSEESRLENREFLERERERPHLGEVAIIKVGTALGAIREKNETASAPDALLKTEVGLIEAIEKIGAKVSTIINIDCSPDPADVFPIPKGGVLNEKGNIRIATDLAREVEQQRKLGRRVIVLGGDHSVSLGTVPGFVAAIKDTYGSDAEGAEVRIDAHGDLQTRDKSPSKAPHGMTEAANYGLMNPSDPLGKIHRNYAKLDPSNVVQIGIRDLDQNEISTPIEHDIQIQTRDRMRQLGLNGAIRTLDTIRQNPSVREFMVSIDVDGLHEHATPMINKDGVRDEEITLLSKFLSTDPSNEAPVTVIEIAEYSPMRDKNDRTAKFIRDQVVLLLGGRPSAVPHQTFLKTKFKKVARTIAAGGALAAAVIGGFFVGKTPTDQGADKPVISTKLPSKSGLLLAATTNPDYRPDILIEKEWNTDRLKERGESMIDIFSERIAGYGKRFQEICDKTKAGAYSKDELKYPIFYMPNPCLSEMTTMLYEAERRDPRAAEALRAALLATFEASFERGEGKTSPREAYSMFGTLYEDFKNRTAEGIQVTKR